MHYCAKWIFWYWIFEGPSNYVEGSAVVHRPDEMLVELVVAISVFWVGLFVNFCFFLAQSFRWVRSDGIVNYGIDCFVRGIFLFIGLAWKDVFETAAADTAKHWHDPDAETPNGQVVLAREATRFRLMLFCVCLLLPAWYHYFFPKSVTGQLPNYLTNDLEETHNKSRSEARRDQTTSVPR